jgi:F-type H+-transporting ATPase subunit epsilon
MNIKILTPEYVVFEGEVNSVLLPGKNGEFHIMKNHAGIVSSLIGGKVKLLQTL